MSASTERVASSGGSSEEEHLRAEIYRLQQQVHELSRPKPAEDSVAAPEKSGYLFKWQDRSIGWGGTKWGLRYVRLENGRLSYYRTHEERSPRYVLTLKDCAVRDDGSKVNRRRNVNKKPSSEDASDMEVGSHFYVFSVYQPSSKIKKTEVNIFGGDDVKYKYEDEIIPLLRFSTQSQAEKNQWIELISQSCAFCDSEEFDRQSSANQKDERQTKSQEGHGRNKGGTLSKLVFEEVEPRSIARKPSGFKLKEMGENFRTKTKDEKAARSNNIQYPPSKPMHRQSSPSYLSKESAHNQNYRGFFNLGMIVLVVSNYRLLIEAVRKHGFIWNELTKLNHDYMKASLSDKLFLFPFVSGISFVQIIIFQTYVIETLLGRHIVCERLGMILHFVNTNLSLGVVCAIVWHLIDSPFVGAGLVMQATVTWLKLISYVHANQDYRLTNSHGTTLAMVKDLDDEDARVRYPENVTLGDIYYFWFAPTLTYQIAFPRVPFVRWSRVLVLTFQLFLSTTLAAFLAMQVVKPNLENLVMDLEENSGEVRTSVIGEYILKLSITVTYIWLLGFFAFFHCFMNICAETLRFGDRVFYRDWWNATEVSAYWRLWNMPVHYWLVRHVYFPSIRIGMSKGGATFMVFLFSAVMHEVLISVPCHMIKVHSFLAMMAQLPLILMTKWIDRRYRGSSVGNIIFWISFCFVGQPMAMVMYTIDYWEARTDAVGGGVAFEDGEPGGARAPLVALRRVFRMGGEL